MVICVTRLGFSYNQVRYLTFGKYVDLFEAYKRIYNFETKKMLYKIDEVKEITSLMDL